jgi:hypothetical protein
VVVVLTVCVFALRPLRRVMSVGFVVLVSTILLRRLERIGILISWFVKCFSKLTVVRLLVCVCLCSCLIKVMKEDSVAVLKNV